MARNKHPEETVEKILDVSMRLFSEKGYEHTTIQDIVDALGMSKGAIYHHFKSKEDIIDRLNDRYYEGLDWFPDLSKIPGENGLEKLRYAFRHFLTDPAKRKVDRLVIGYVVKNPKITLLTLESTFRERYARNLTLSRLSEAVILPLSPDKGSCMHYDPSLPASVFLQNDLKMLLRMRNVLE